MSRALGLSAGVLVWALHFTFVYGFVGYACARGLEGTLPWAVGLATAAAAGLAAALLVRGLRRRSGFEDAVGAGLAGFALLAILWEGASILLVTSCVSR